VITYVLLFMIGVVIACHISISRDKKNTKVFEVKVEEDPDTDDITN